MILRPEYTSTLFYHLWVDFVIHLLVCLIYLFVHLSIAAVRTTLLEEGGGPSPVTTPRNSTSPQATPRRGSSGLLRLGAIFIELYRVQV